MTQIHLNASYMHDLFDELFIMYVVKKHRERNFQAYVLLRSVYVDMTNL